MKKRREPVITDVLDDQQLIANLMAQVVLIEGTHMSMREAQIRSLYRASLNRDMTAAVELQKIRDAAELSGTSRPAGYLVVPEPMSEEEFEQLVFDQQAQFRTRTAEDGG